MNIKRSRKFDRNFKRNAVLFCAELVRMVKESLDQQIRKERLKQRI